MPWVRACLHCAALRKRSRFWRRVKALSRVIPARPFETPPGFGSGRSARLLERAHSGKLLSNYYSAIVGGRDWDHSEAVEIWSETGQGPPESQSFTLRRPSPVPRLHSATLRSMLQMVWLRQ
jgi:hypothetical protein